MHQSSSTDLNAFVNQCKIRLKKILNRLEWSEEVTLKDFNTNSVASSRKKELKHPNAANIVTFPDSCITQNSLALETSKLQKILNNSEVEAPRNFRELQANFSREQKLKIYEHVIENTKKLENNSVDQEAEGELSLADILAQKKREEKCKKRRFRKSKPTHIEEVRCLVDLQMQALQQFIDNKHKKKQQVTWQKERAQKDKLSYEDESGDRRNRYKDYHRREHKRDNFTELREKPDGLRRHHRSRSKECVRHKHKRYKRSSSRNLSYDRKRYSRSRSKDCTKRARRSRSYSRNNSKERNSKKIAQKRDRSRSHERRSRSHSKEISKEIKNYRRSRSYERNSRKKDNGNYRKYFSRKENGAYYGHTNEKYEEKYYKKEIKSFEQRSIRDNTKDEYESSRQSQSKKSRHKS